MGNSQEDVGTIRQTIICNIEAQRLEGVSARNIIEFKKWRELYEEQTSEKSQGPDTKIVPTFMKASFDDADLRIFPAGGWINAGSIQEITETQIAERILKRCRWDESDENLS